MKHKKIAFILPLIIFLSGCETLSTPHQRREEDARQKLVARHAEEQNLRLKGQIETLNMEVARMTREIQQLRSDARAYQSQISQLNTAMKSLEAKQAREMRELISRVEGLLKKSVAAQQSSQKSQGRGAGREHVVESGHTLSAIATAYNTTVKAIKQANKLKSDNIYVGQKLFIPE